MPRRLRTKSRKAQILSVLGTAVTVAAIALAVSILTAKPQLMVSESTSRDEARPLASAQVSGSVHIFVEGAPVGSTVSFFLDGDSEAFSVEETAPYDMTGGSQTQANTLLVSSLGGGPHELMAVIEPPVGPVDELGAEFYVDPLSLPVPDLPPVTPPPDAVRIPVGAAAAEIVSAHPPGTSFLFEEGTHVGLTVRPRDGDHFIGEPGAILDGNGAEFAFRSDASDVVIEGFTIQSYRPRSREAVIHAEEGSSAWTVRNSVIRHNGEIGIRAYPMWVVEDTIIQDNGRYGMVGSGGELIVSNNEIYSNAIEIGATGDSSATKFVFTEALRLTGNHVHGNRGNGLWVDVNNVDPLIEDNLVEANELSGIFLEISCGGVIRGNTVEGNGLEAPDDRWMTPAGILVSRTPNALIEGNFVDGNRNGIAGSHPTHPDTHLVDRCRPQLRGLEVRNNTVVQDRGSAAGIEGNDDGDAVWSEWENRFTDNTYEIGPDTVFRWQGRSIGFEEWLEAGQS